MRLKVGSKIYPTSALDDISLKDLLLFKTQAEPFTWNDVQRLQAELEEMDEEQAGKAMLTNSDYFLPLAATVWIARRGAGEHIDFWDAVDVPTSEIQMLPDPEDKKPGKPKGPKKAQKSTQPSAPVDEPAAASPGSPS